MEFTHFNTEGRAHMVEVGGERKTLKELPSPKEKSK